MCEWRKACQGSYQGLADGDHIGAFKQLPKSLPVFFIRELVEIGPHCLIDVYTQGSAKPVGDSRHLRQTEVVRLHHNGDDRYRDAQPYTTVRLLMDELPVPRAALRILLLLSGVIQ
jgi:hypothetical protein